MKDTRKHFEKRECVCIREERVRVSRVSNSCANTKHPTLSFSCNIPWRGFPPPRVKCWIKQLLPFQPPLLGSADDQCGAYDANLTLASHPRILAQARGNSLSYIKGVICLSFDSSLVIFLLYTIVHTTTTTMLSSSLASSAPDTTTNNHHPIMSISSLLEPSSDHHASSTFMQLTTPPPPLLPPMVSPSSTTTTTTTASSHHYEDDELLLPPLDKTLFMQHSSSSSSGGSRSPSPDPRDSTLEERRRRNKIASAKYRAKRSQENKNMRQALEHLRRQNAVLLQALNDVYRDKSNMGDAAAAAEQQSSWPLLNSTSAAGAQEHDDGNIHCATTSTCTIHHPYPRMSL